MRNISVYTLNLLKEKYGLEPINFITVQWVDYGFVYYYSDKRYPNDDRVTFEPRILELGNIENVVKLSDNSRSQSISIKLDDSDGALKGLIDQVDIHKRKVGLWQWFQGIPLNEAFLIFQGEVNSPIIWKEGDRTLQFEIVEKLEDREIGFSPEEGQFDFIPEEFVGKPFPLGFGTNIRVPAVKINAPPVGITRHPIGFADPSLKPKINQNAEKINAYEQARYLDALFAGGCAMAAYLMEQDIKDLERLLAQEIDWKTAKEAIQKRNSSPINELGYGESQSIAGYTLPSESPGVITNESRPTGDAFTKNYGSSSQTGANISESFTVLHTSATEAVGDTEDEADINSIQSAISDLESKASQMRSLQQSYEQKAAQGASQLSQIKNDNSDLEDILRKQLKVGQITSVINGDKFPRGPITVQIGEVKANGSFAGDVFNPAGLIPNPTDNETIGNDNNKKKTRLSSERKPNVDENIEKGKFVIINPGATVKLISNFPIYYIVNLLPSAIHEVLAKRVVNGGASVLTAIPPQYYTVQFVPFTRVSDDVVVYNCTVIQFYRGLSTYDEGWEEEVFVTFTSPVGPNTIDIMEWLIGTYSRLQIDPVSFTYVRDKVAFCPMHFVLYDRKNILTILEELAFQARLGLWIDNEFVKVEYLPEDKDPVDVITEADIEYNSLELEHTSTENLVTKFVANYRFHHEDKQPNKIVLRYNISKYGTLEKEYDYYAYNIGTCVYQSASFWLSRKANTWKRIKFKTPLNKLNLETFDRVVLDFPNRTQLGGYVANGPVIGIIESAKYDSASWTIEFEVWVPVRIGEMTPYPFAWPANLSPYFYFPTNEEVSDGSIGVEPNNGIRGNFPASKESFGEITVLGDNTPRGHPRIAFQGNRPRDQGPSNPSDNLLRQVHQIADYQSGTVDSFAPGVITVVENPDTVPHKVGDVIDVGTNTVRTINAATILTGIGLGKLVALELTPELTSPVPSGGVVLRGLSRAQDIGAPIKAEQPYNYRSYGAIPDPSSPPGISAGLPTAAGTGQAMPIQIVSGTGFKHVGDIFPNGINKPGKRVAVRILQIDSSESIPPGTKLIAIKINGIYYAQCPIWL